MIEIWQYFERFPDSLMCTLTVMNFTTIRRPRRGGELFHKSVSGSSRLCLGRPPGASDRDEVRDGHREEERAERGHGDLRADGRVEDEAALDGGGDESAERGQDAEQGQDRHDVHRVLPHLGPPFFCHSCKNMFNSPGLTLNEAN